MRIRWCVTPVIVFTALVTAMPALAADETRVRAATQQVETGAKTIGRGEIGKGFEGMAKGIGGTVVEGAKFTGEKFKEAGKAAERAPSFPDSVKNFFTRLFTN
jgi:hypothetical protein